VGKDLPVNVSSKFGIKLGGKPRSISIEAVSGCEIPSFKHAGQVIVYEVPASYCMPV
jgi:hypothetical protein